MKKQIYIAQLYKTILFALLFLAQNKVFGQDLLAKDSAVAIALEQNYGIKLANNNLLIAENNASILNSNYIPKITAKAGSNYSHLNLNYESQEGNKTAINGSTNFGYNASIGLNYTLFDGLGRSYTYKKWKENFQLSQLEAQAIIESTLVQLFSAYYNVAYLSETADNIKTSIEISENRFMRAKYNFEYGKSTKLDVSNAEVDLNNDKIRYLSIKSQLVTAKHNLNLLLGRKINTEFRIDTTVIYNQGISIADLLETAKQKNVSLLIANKNLDISQYTLKENKALWLPRIELSSNYGFGATQYDEHGIYAYSDNLGLTGTLNLSWNLFDGGLTKNRIQNAKIALNNFEIQKTQSEQSLKRDLLNLWELYQNSLFVRQAELLNLKTAELNFSRSKEQFQLGQISSIEFRAAQLNLLNAKTSQSQAKFDAKILELQLLQLNGTLLEAKY